MKLTQFSLLVLLVTFSFNFTSAQEKEKDLTQGINIYLFDGYAVGYRFNECENSFWRVNLDLYGRYTDNISNSDSHRMSGVNGDTTSTEIKGKDSRFSITLTPQYLYMFYQNKYAAFYTGGGILVGYDYSELKSTYQHDRYYKSYSYQFSSSNGISLGIIAILGLEAKLTENFSVFVESQLSEARSWFTTSSNTTSSDNGTELSRIYSSQKNRGWTTNLELTRAGIVVRF